MIPTICELSKLREYTKERYFKTGEAKLLILDMLRTATEPLSTSNIGKKIAFDKGFAKEENFNLENFLKVILASLSRCQSNGTVERIGKDGLSILWQIKT